MLVPVAVVAQTLTVDFTIEELYSSVNNPANAGATLLQRPGDLPPVSQRSVRHVNASQHWRRGSSCSRTWRCMSVEGDRSAVVISAYDLPLSSFPQNGAISWPQ